MNYNLKTCTKDIKRINNVDLTTLQAKSVCTGQHLRAIQFFFRIYSSKQMQQVEND